LTTDDIFGAQAGTSTLDYATKIQLKNIKSFAKNPLFGGPKYGNKDLKTYEEERDRSLVNSKSSFRSSTEDPIPINRLQDKSRQRTRRYYLNRYANFSNLSFDWQGKAEKDYKHPLGLKHTALDLHLRERTRNKNICIGNEIR
jgi:hypothetical protein